MKKFISMVMAAAMVVSLVPATAFAASGSAVFKTVGAIEVKEGTDATALEETGLAATGDKVQLQIVLTDVNTVANEPDTFEITLDFDNIEVRGAANGGVFTNAKVVRGATGSDSTVGTADLKATIKTEPSEAEDSSLDVTITEGSIDFVDGDVIILPLNNNWFYMTDDSEGTVGTVTVSGDLGDSEALPVASVLAEGIDVTVAGKPVEVAAEDEVELKDITIESVVGKFASDDEIKVKVSKGWEIVDEGTFTAGSLVAGSLEEDEFVIHGVTVAEFKIQDMKVEAVSAEAGDICVVSVSCKDYEGDSDEAAVVIEDAVVMSVDEDDDVPVFYSGVNVKNDGLQVTDDHKALEVTIEETVVDAWDTVGAWTLTLPEGVYAVDGTTVSAKYVDSWKGVSATTDPEDVAFAEAYKDGDYEYFDFGRRALTIDSKTEKAVLTLNLVLVAEPEFTGEVVLTLEGDDLEAQEVVIAEFVKPYTVAAAQNDLVIDYKETLVPTEVTITEAEMGLWDDNTTNDETAVFAFVVEDIEVEDADVTVNEDDSDMTIEDKAKGLGKYDAGFTVDEESDECEGVVTLSNIELYMERNIPAGAYDLEMVSSLAQGFMGEKVFGITDTTKANDANWAANQIGAVHYDDDAFYVETVKEGFVNVITAGRDQDDASFTKKVVVPVGAMEIVAGEDVVALDVPAYINAAGYTMLPVRAVAVALGINTNNVIWDQATKTVTILYGQRIITMTVGQKVINVNGSAIPASAAVEVVNGRTFLGLRDLATALGVVDITWDAATQTATLNGGNK